MAEKKVSSLTLFWDGLNPNQRRISAIVGILAVIFIFMAMLTGVEEELVKKELASGEADIVIGTHSLIQEGVNCDNLGLVVIDEQHKFGVSQRKKLRSTSGSPDTLLMTATPIPRSLVLTVFGDMDVSTLKEKPEFIEAVAYESAMILFTIVSRADIRYRSYIKNALMNLNNFQGVTGLKSFDNNGETKKKLYLLRIKGKKFIELNQK